MKNNSVNVSYTSRPHIVYNLYTNDFHLVAIWYTIGRPGRIGKIFPSTIRRRVVYVMYTWCIQIVSIKKWFWYTKCQPLVNQKKRKKFSYIAWKYQYIP